MAKKHTKPESTPDATSRGPSRDMQRDASHDVVTPADAAERLGVTADAVRARLRRGSLPGERVDGEWLVHLPPGTIRATRGATSRDGSRDTRRLNDVDVTSLLAAKDETIAAKDAALAALTRDVDWLRGQLDARSRELAAERERADTLHRLALNRIEALTSGLTEREEDSETASEPPATHQDDLSATITPMMDESLSNSAEPVKRAWWRRIIWGE